MVLPDTAFTPRVHGCHSPLHQSARPVSTSTWRCCLLWLTPAFGLSLLGPFDLSIEAVLQVSDIPVTRHDTFLQNQLQRFGPGGHIGRRGFQFGNAAVRPFELAGGIVPCPVQQQIG